jgi:cytochrome c-type biogenesis protein CcmE
MPGNRKVGVIVTTIVAVAAIGVMGKTFVSNASPYVDVAGALTTQGDELHLLGNIDKTTVRSEDAGRSLTFDLVDLKQKRIHVCYQGEPISNISEADRVVAVGGVKQGEYYASRLLIKCPSKYDSTPAGTAKSI